MIDTMEVETRAFCEVFSLSISISAHGIQVTPHDLGCELDADDMAALLPVVVAQGMQCNPVHELEPQDFETLYRWFIS